MRVAKSSPKLVAREFSARSTKRPLSSPAPVFSGFAPHGRRFRIFGLDPMRPVCGGFPANASRIARAISSLVAGDGGAPSTSSRGGFAPAGLLPSRLSGDARFLACRHQRGTCELRWRNNPLVSLLDFPRPVPMTMTEQFGLFWL